MLYRLVNVRWFDPDKTNERDTVRVEFTRETPASINWLQRIAAFFTNYELPQPIIETFVGHVDLYVFRYYPTGERAEREVEIMVSEWAAQFKYVQKMNAEQAAINERLKRRLSN